MEYTAMSHPKHWSVLPSRICLCIAIRAGLQERNLVIRSRSVDGRSKIRLSQVTFIWSAYQHEKLSFIIAFKF